MTQTERAARILRAFEPETPAIRLACGQMRYSDAQKRAAVRLGRNFGHVCAGIIMGTGAHNISNWTHDGRYE